MPKNQSRNLYFPNLTKTEISILEYLSNGNTDKQISINRSRSIHTTRNQIKSIYQKLNVNNRTKAAIIYSNIINNKNNNN
jgi:DNA-binding NarL/FixJ family response regulator